MVMIPKTAIMKYREAYPKSNCYYGEPSGYIIVSMKRKKSREQPEDETEKQFLDRIERSKQAGRNLFFDEWPELQYEDDCLY